MILSIPAPHIEASPAATHSPCELYTHGFAAHVGFVFRQQASEPLTEAIGALEVVTDSVSCQSTARYGTETEVVGESPTKGGRSVESTQSDLLWHL